jgi:hypothetical protein
LRTFHFILEAFVSIGAPELFVDVALEIDSNEGAYAVFEFLHRFAPRLAILTPDPR